MAFNQTLAWLALSIAAFSPAAHAVLGGNAASITQDRIHTKAALRVQQQQNYAVHELANESGTTVREYANAEGKVFALTWSGPLMPDLRQLLGPYFPQYVTQPGEPGNSHTRRTVRHEGLVVHSSGRMRAFSGKAYLESAIPNGVDVDALP